MEKIDGLYNVIDFPKGVSHTAVWPTGTVWIISELNTDGYHCTFPDVFHFNDDYDDNDYSAHCDDWRHLRQSDAGTVPHPDGSWGRDGRHRLLRHRRTLELSTQSPLDCSVNNLAVCSTLHMVAQSLWMTHNTEQLNPQWAEHCSGLTPQWREHCGFAGPQWVTK